MKIKKAAGPLEKIVMKTKASTDQNGSGLLAEWWKAPDEQLAAQLCSTAAYLKINQTYRVRQIAVNVRLYAGLSVYSYAGSNVSKMDRNKALPEDRPTFNLIQSCADTLISRMTQNEPAPRFLTDGADYKQRHLAQRLNKFVLGEFYQTDAYSKGVKALRDAIVIGTGVLKVYKGDNNKVCIDRVMESDLYTDDNDSLNAEPQQMIQFKLMDRDRLLALNPKEMHSIIENAPQGYPDNAQDAGRTVADQLMVIEGWKLASGTDRTAPGYMPGRHTITLLSGVLLDEPYHRTVFPFVFLNYSDPFLGFWGQGLGTQLFGTQLALNRIMYTISRAITLVGVPRIFVENSSKVVSAHLNDAIGVICKYTGTKPIYEVAPCNAKELYSERDKLIEYGYRQCGVSNMQATSQKPAGLNSGEAIRTADDIFSDRFTSFVKKYEDFYVDLAYLITAEAMDIAEEIGSYQTIYPNKDGTKEIDLPQMNFLKDPFVIQCFSESSLPRQPGARIETVTEWIQSGMVTLKEGRRLMKAPDLEDNEKLDNASEERIFQILDKIVEDGKYTPPDVFLDPELATKLTVQYINLYLAANLEKEKADMLRKFFRQVQFLKGQAMPMQIAPAPEQEPTANPMPNQTSPLVPNTNAPAAA